MKTMKKRHIPILLAALFTALLVSCKDEDSFRPPPDIYFTIKNESGLALEAVWWNGTSFGDIAHANHVQKTVNPGAGRISFVIAGKGINARTLRADIPTENEGREFRFTVSTWVEEINDVNFYNSASLPSLKKTVPPKVGAVNAVDVARTSARLSASASNPGHPEYNAKGFCYSKNLSDLELASNCHAAEGDFAMSLLTLTPDTEYHAKAYVANGVHPKQYSAVIKFKTEGSSLTIKNESGLALGSIVWNGTDFGSIPNGASVEKTVRSGSGRITFRITGRDINARTQNIIQVEPGSGAEFMFTAGTPAEELNDIEFANAAELAQLKKSVPPEVGAVNASSLTGTSVRLISSVRNEGYPKYAEKGICHSANLGDIDLASNCQPVEGSEFARTLTGLTPGARYYAKAYVTNGAHPPQYSETLGYYTKSPNLLWGCWYNGSYKICYNNNGTGYTDWIYSNNDREGYQFTYTATDAEIKLTVTMVYWDVNGVRSQSTTDFNTSRGVIPAAQTLPYEISPDGSRLDFKNLGTYYIKQ